MSQMMPKLNRAQRRQAARANSEEMVLELLEQNTRKAMKITIDYYSTAVAHVLLERLGFGKKKLELTMGQVQETIVMLESGELSLEDLKERLKTSDIELN